MRYRLIIFTALIFTLFSCSDSKEQELIRKENELLKKELELNKREGKALSKNNKTIQSHKTEEQKFRTEPVPEKVIPITEANKFMPKNYQIVQSEKGPNIVSGYLNNDEYLDFAVLVAKGENLIDYSNSEDVRVLIYEGTDSNEYIKTSQSGNLTKVFIHYNIAPKLKISNKNVINLSHQSMRHHYDLKFRYEKEERNYMLIGSDYNNYGNAAKQGAGTISTNFLTGKRIENLMDFDTEKEKIYDLPEKILEFNKPLIPINKVSYYNVYSLISG